MNMTQLAIYTFVALTMVGGMACQRSPQPMSKNGQKEPGSFSTAAEAANKAKRDILAVIRSGKNINLGLDEAAVEKSQPAAPIRRYQLTFETLLSAESAGAFSNLAQHELATVVPLVADNSVVTIAEVARDDKGWRVVGLSDKNVSNELNVLRRAAGDAPQGEITIYDLPHSLIRVYGVRRNNVDVFYTDYPGFSVLRGVSAERLLPSVKRDAADFQREHGEALKNRKLVR